MVRFYVFKGNFSIKTLFCLKNLRPEKDILRHIAHLHEALRKVRVKVFSLFQCVYHVLFAGLGTFCLYTHMHTYTHTYDAHQNSPTTPKVVTEPAGA